MIHTQFESMLCFFFLTARELDTGEVRRNRHGDGDSSDDGGGSSKKDGREAVVDLASY